jgi:hypothetical protein
MAKIRKNGNILQLSGSIGDMVFRQMPDGSTRVSRKPDFSKRIFSRAQKDHQSRFKQAAAYAREAAKTQPIYAELAKGTTKNAYNWALSDWFNRPEILEIDLSGWVNGEGGTIRVRAQDDVVVEGVKVTIADENGAFLEEGEAQEASALWWEYNTAQAAANNMRVTVAARDLPGHVTEKTELKGHPMMP